MRVIGLAAAAGAGLALIYLFLTAPKWRDKRKRMEKMLGCAYAHRGLHGDTAPENSLAAFRAAVEKGYGIELDVHLSRDGHLIVHHDDSLLRMCGVDLPIQEATLEEIKQLFLSDSHERVPTLEEALDVIQGKVPLIVELKSASSRKRLAEKVSRAMGDYPGVWCMESFDPRLVLWFRRHARQVPRGQLAYDPAKIPQDQRRGFRYWAAARLLMNCLSRPDFVAYGYESDRNLSFRLMRALFHPVLAAWTVRSQEDFNKLKGRYDLQIFESFLP